MSDKAALVWQATEAFAGFAMLYNGFVIRWIQMRARANKWHTRLRPFPTRDLFVLGVVLIVHAAIWWRYG